MGSFAIVQPRGFGVAYLGVFSWEMVLHAFGGLLCTCSETINMCWLDAYRAGAEVEEEELSLQFHHLIFDVKRRICYRARQQAWCSLRFNKITRAK